MIAASGAQADTFVRVITQEATIRTGPGGDFRAVKQAERGQVFEVAERGTRGYWLRVQLDDGTSGWVFGEQVATFEVTDEGESWITRALRSIRTAILGPSPVPESNVELSFSAGEMGVREDSETCALPICVRGRGARDARLLAAGAARRRDVGVGVRRAGGDVRGDRRGGELDHEGAALDPDGDPRAVAGARVERRAVVLGGRAG